ncbi:MAG: DUF4349 domain-containing protein [Lachnospiraceae bacterium]|nr:DUF4349 domain-containing protein [Lachnospiraceae bacterium]
MKKYSFIEKMYTYYGKNIQLTALILACCVLSACGNSSEKSEEAYSSNYESDEVGNYAVMDGDMSAENKAAAADGSGTAELSKGDTAVSLAEEKIIYTGNISIKTQNFEKTVSECKAMIDSYKGIIESENYYDNSGMYAYGGDDSASKNREYSVAVRVPSESYSDFMNGSEKLDGIIDSKNSSAENISQQYSDASIELESYQSEFKRLQELMEQASEMDDIIAIGQQMTTVRTEIDQLKSDLRRMDTDVAYSTINVSVHEVSKREAEQPEKQTYLKRLSIAFRNSISDFGDFIVDFSIGIVEVWPFLLVIVLIIVSACKFRKRKKAKALEKESKKEE